MGEGNTQNFFLFWKNILHQQKWKTIAKDKVVETLELTYIDRLIRATH